jgi:hypothetical protein
LFAFLADDGCDATGEAIVTVLSEDLDHVLQGAEDDVGEGCGESDGIIDVGGRELVLAGEDGGLAEVFEAFLGVDCVELFLLGDY